MEFSIKSGSPEKQRSACVVVGVFEPRKLTLPAELLDNAARSYISDIIRRGDLEGKLGTTLLLHNVPGTLCDRVLLVGLGKEKEFREKEFRQAMDAGLNKIVTETFVRLYKEGLIYRGKRLVNWDPKLHTAVSDLEVVSEEEDGFLWHIRYPLADGSGSLTVATTRPETMLGDTAVMVHPDDERYQHLIGKTIKLPLSDREIPIIADAYVDMAFGTGCVKVTPAHDFNDYAVGQRHHLPMISVLTLDGHINDQVPEQYRGLDRFEARKVVVADLEAMATSAPRALG